jgi:hypothetical protein
MALALMADHFRNGSNSEILARADVFRFAPESGLKSDIPGCLECAKRGHRTSKPTYPLALLTSTEKSAIADRFRQPQPVSDERVKEIEWSQLPLE